MGLGHEIIREQRFFRMELRERVFWFIRLRWVAVGLAGTGLVWARAAGLPIPVVVLGGVTAFMALYNLGFLIAAARLEPGPAAQTAPFEIFAHVQIGFDLLTLFLFIYFTGGLASPLLFFCSFHVILAGILLSPASCYAYAAVVMAAAALLLSLHRLGLAPWPGPGLINGAELPLLPLNRLMLHALLFAAGILIIAYLTVSIKTALRHKGRELMHVSRDLEITNARLTALYGMIRESLESPDLTRLMGNAVDQAARIMGVTACSIKLLDPDRQTLRYAARPGPERCVPGQGAHSCRPQPHQPPCPGRLVVRHRTGGGGRRLRTSGRTAGGGHRLHALPAAKGPNTDTGRVLRV